MARSTLLAVSTGFTCLVFAFSACPAPGADIAFTNGTTIRTRSLVYDAASGQLGYSLKGTSTKCPLSQVKWIKVDESEMVQLEANLNALRQENQGLSSQAADLKKKLQDSQALVGKYTMGTPAANPTPPSAEQEQRIQQLEKDRQDLQEQVAELRQKLQRQTAQAQGSSAPASAIASLPPRPAVSGACRWSASTESGFVTVTGECSNPTSRAFRDVVIELTAYDKANRPLCMGYTYLSNLASKEKRPFQGDVEVDSRAVQEVRATVTEAYEAIPSGAGR